MTDTQTALPPIKRVGPLQTPRDAKMLQARLLRLFIAGKIDEVFFKSCTYGINNLLNCIKVEHLISPLEQESVAFEIICTTSTDLQKKIDLMNSDIMPAPE
ncbi:MAG: hypothetical protein ACI8ZB_002573 [Desulforhopalus sp.]|jgi:hypothetical protein